MMEFFVLGIILALIIGVFIGYHIHKKSASRDMRSLTHYRSTYLEKTGYSYGYGDFQLRSFDGGKHWYTVNTEAGVVIEGLAEEKFPGLLTHLEGIDRLVEYTKENGPITLAGDRSAKDIEVLAGIDFKIEDKQKQEQKQKL